MVAEARDIKIDFQLNSKQLLAWHTLHQDNIREVLYGGAKGGGKSVLGCFWCLSRAYEIIKEFGLGPQQYPIPVGFMGRKVGKDFRDTTLETWKRFMPPDLYRMRGGDEIILGNAVKIIYGGLDSRESIHKFNSAEYAFIFIDQAEEVSRDDVSTPRGTARLVIDDREVVPKALFTANPAQCWLKEEFIEDPPANLVFIQALPADNPKLPAGYVDTLKFAFKHRPELLEAYVHGNWDALAGFDQIIKDSWIRRAREVTIHWPVIRKLVACDVARFGNDETVIIYGENTEIVEQEVYGKRDLVYTANRCHIMSQKHGGCIIVVDEDGPGGGPIDILRDMGDDVIGIHSAGTARDPAKYYNVRAEMWDTAARSFEEGAIQLHNCDGDLRRQLTSAKYEFRRGRILVQEKAKIKAVLGRSPDHADAYLMQLYMQPMATVEPRPSKRRQFAAQTEAVAGNNAFMAM